MWNKIQLLDRKGQKQRGFYVTSYKAKSKHMLSTDHLFVLVLEYVIPKS